MRLFSLTIPKPLEAAVGACRRRFALAAGPSALLIILYLAPVIDTMRINDQAVLIGGVQTLLWITVIVGLTIATLAALGSQTSDGREMPRGIWRRSA